MSSKTSPWKWITELLHSSIRTPDERRIGIEIERIGLWPDGSALHYSKSTGPRGEERPGAFDLLSALEKKHRWPVIKNEEGYPLGFSSPYGKVSLEPGSQVELSADAAVDLVSVEKSAQAFEGLVDTITRPWGLTWTGIGVNPRNTVDEMDVIPSRRYQIMTDYLGQRARLGTAMMRLTSSVQVNLDYTSETKRSKCFESLSRSRPSPMRSLRTLPSRKEKRLAFSPIGVRSGERPIRIDPESRKIRFEPDMIFHLMPILSGIAR